MIRIATIGTSSITSCFLDALASCEGARFVGTLSRDSERASAFTLKHGGTRPFTSLDELAGSDEVDAVYIGSPNALHHDQALACIRGGKHVLVEKPFCATEGEAREVFEAAREVGVAALEAMRPLHDPAFHALRDELDSLGRIRRATLRFGKYSSRYDEILAGRHTNIFDCALATGSLMDIGVYTVEPLVELFGAPERIHCAPVMLDADSRELTNGAIDGAGVITASYPGMVATLHYSKITSDLAESQIEGENGTLTVDSISTPAAARVDLRRAPEAGDSVGYSSTETSSRPLDLPACKNSMVYEATDFLCAIRSLKSGADFDAAEAGGFGTLAHFRDVTLTSLSIMDEARRQAGIEFPADGR